MLYGLETAALMKRQEAEMEVAELKMLRFLLGIGVTRKDQELIHQSRQRDSTGGTVWRENTRGKTEVVWTCTEER